MWYTANTVHPGTAMTVKKMPPAEFRLRRVAARMMIKWQHLQSLRSLPEKLPTR